MTTDKLTEWAEQYGVKVSTLKQRAKGPATTPATNPARKARKTMKKDQKSPKAPATKRGKKADKPATTPVEVPAPAPVVEALIAVPATPAPVSVAKPVVVPVMPTPAPVVEAPIAVSTAPTPRLSLKDKILQGKRQLNGAVREIHEETEVLASVEMIGAFVDAINAADVVAAMRQGWAKDDGSPDQKKWDTLSLSELEAQMQVWANEGDPTATDVLGAIAGFRETRRVNIVAPLWDLAQEIRATQKTEGYKDFTRRLSDLVAKNLIAKGIGKLTQFQMDEAVQIGVRKGDIGYYLPTMKNGKPAPMAEAIWSYVKDAEARAQGHASDKERCLYLVAQSDGITASGAKKGKSGKVFLTLAGLNHSVLMDVRKLGEKVHVRVIRTAGVYVRQPAPWVDWDAPEASWPSPEIFRAVQAWKKI